MEHYWQMPIKRTFYTLKSILIVFVFKCQLLYTKWALIGSCQSKCVYVLWKDWTWMKQRKIFTNVFLHLVYCLQWLHLVNAQFDLFSFSWYLVNSKLIHRSVSQTSVFSLPPPYDVCLLEIECDLDANTCGEQLLCSAQVSSKSFSSFSLEQNRETIWSKCFY